VTGNPWEGRIGRTRREADGIAPGTWVQVDPDSSSDGWHLLLTSRDPRDGPGEGWDVWASTEDDVRTWLGPDRLDVAWSTGPLPDRALARLVGTSADGWRFQHVSVEGVAAWLHDADVAMSEVVLEGTAAIVPGLVESLWEGPARRLGWPRMVRARFPFLLVVEPASRVDTDDPEGIDQVIVGDVHHDDEEGTLVIASAIPGAVRIGTPARTYRLATARRPTLVRHRWRWEPFAPEPTPRPR
jgi:hypothetical protein